MNYALPCCPVNIFTYIFKFATYLKSFSWRLNWRNSILKEINKTVRIVIGNLLSLKAILPCSVSGKQLNDGTRPFTSDMITTSFVIASVATDTNDL